MRGLELRMVRRAVDERLLVATERLEWRVYRLTGRRYDAYVSDYGQEVRTDARPYRVTLKTGHRTRVKLEPKDHGGERVDLRAYVPALCPGGSPRVLWHRVLAFLWDNPDKKPYASFSLHDAGHARDEWWFVRARGCHWLTPAANRAEQGARGLAGQAGERDRRRPPAWARAAWASDSSSS